MMWAAHDDLALLRVRSKAPLPGHCPKPDGMDGPVVLVDCVRSSVFEAWVSGCCRSMGVVINAVVGSASEQGRSWIKGQLKELLKLARGREASKAAGSSEGAR